MCGAASGTFGTQTESAPSASHTYRFPFALLLPRSRSRVWRLAPETVLAWFLVLDYLFRRETASRTDKRSREAIATEEYGQVGTC